MTALDWICIGIAWVVIPYPFATRLGRFIGGKCDPSIRDERGQGGEINSEPHREHV